MPRVSIIIVNYNTFTLTGNCIRSILQYAPGKDWEIVLVDNSSTERNADDFLAEFPSIQLIKSPSNGGFACGNNLGITKATGEFILLLNSDTYLKEDAISATLQFLQQSKGAGLAGCRMVYPDGKIQYTARRFRSISWELLDLFRFIPLMMPYQKRARRMLGKYFRHDQDIEADWINGAFLLFARGVLNQLPGHQLDDRFFMYGEDQLWSEQIKNLGHAVMFYSGSSIVHISSGSSSLSKQLSLRKTMMKHELSIMKSRKGKGAYYYTFKIIYVSKETTRNFFKSIFYGLTGRVMR